MHPNCNDDAIVTAQLSALWEKKGTNQTCYLWKSMGWIVSSVPTGWTCILLATFVAVVMAVQFWVDHRPMPDGRVRRTHYKCTSPRPLSRSSNSNPRMQIRRRSVRRFLVTRVDWTKSVI
jgi:hypothetical protein